MYSEKEKRKKKCADTYLFANTDVGKLQAISAREAVTLLSTSPEKIIISAKLVASTKLLEIMQDISIKKQMLTRSDILSFLVASSLAECLDIKEELDELSGTAQAIGITLDHGLEPSCWIEAFRLRYKGTVPLNPKYCHLEDKTAATA